MPTIRVGLNVGATSSLPKESTFEGTISLPYEVHDPINISAMTFHMKNVRIYTKYTYLTFSCGTTSGWTAVFATSDGNATMREVGADLNWPHGNILAQNGRPIVFTVKSSNPSWTGNFFGIYNVVEFWIDIDYTVTTTACTPPASLWLSSSLSEGAVTLYGDGAGAGVSNSITGYEVQYCDSADGANWGGWAGYTTAYTGAGSFAIAVPPPDVRGYYRKFRARTLGSAGSAYYSGWRESGTVRRNQAPAPPSWVSASPALYESGGITISWGAGSDPDGNLAHYTVEYATSSDGGATLSAWTWLTNTSGLSAAHWPSLTRGHHIVYRVWSCDAFGIGSAPVMSGWVRQNASPVTPVIDLPGTSKTTFNTMPYFVLTLSAEPDGQTQTLYYTVDGGAAISLGTVSAGTKRVRLTSMAAGSHVIVFFTQDSLGAKSSNTQRTITIAANTYARAIAQGTTLTGGSNDLTELLSKINTLRSYYGLGAAAFTLSTKNFHTWMANITVLRNALKDTCALSGASTPTWTSRALNQGPSAKVINEIREYLASL